MLILKLNLNYFPRKLNKKKLFADCILNIHRLCVKVLDENCPGPFKKDKGNDRISKLMDKIRPERDARRKPGLNFVQSNYLYLFILPLNN